MPDEGLKWKRTSEIYWDPNYTEEQPFQPLRYPDAATRPEKGRADRAKKKDERGCSR